MKEEELRENVMWGGWCKLMVRCLCMYAVRTGGGRNVDSTLGDVISAGGAKRDNSMINRWRQLSMFMALVVLTVLVTK